MAWEPKTAQPDSASKWTPQTAEPDAAVDVSKPADPVRTAYRGTADTLYTGINDVGHAIGKAASYITPDYVKNKISSGIDNWKKDSLIYNTGKLIKDIGSSEINDLATYDTATDNLKKDLGALGKNAQAAVNIPIVKPVAELGANLTGKGLGLARETLNSASDSMATKVPLGKEDAFVVKTLKKAGHSPDEIVGIMDRVKNQGMSVGQASQNPKLLGIERKISGLNQPGGTMMRDFAKEQIDPQNNVSMPYKLKDIADPLATKVEQASKEIGSIADTAPKTTVSMDSVERSLAKESRPPKSPITNTLDRIDGLVDWAKMRGGSFADWHRVKQEIWNMKAEAKEPSAIEKLDEKTVNSYYKKINEVLGGKTPGLPEELRATGAKYSAANNAFKQNLSGRTIQEVLAKMPTGGTPSSSLKFLYKQLAGSKELQEELFAGMPESQHTGMVKLLEAIKDTGRSGTNDLVKSMEDGSPSFPFSKSGVLHKAFSAIADAITRKDYDALAKALTSPDAEMIAKKLGYIKPVAPPKPILRLTYQPKAADVLVNKGGAAKIATESEQAAANQARERMRGLGYDPGILRVQDLNIIKAMEQKYGQSELGKFVIANRNEPIMGRAWEVPQTEYSQATVDRMLRDSAWQKLAKSQREAINAEMKSAWDSHQVTLADMVLSARQAARELAAAKGESGGIGNVGQAMLDAISTGTPVQNVLPAIKP